MATISSVTAIFGPNRTSQRRTRVVCISGFNTFSGLKAQNNVVSLGIPVAAEKAFAKIVSSLRKTSKGKKGGGALSAACSAVAEIFRIAAIMPGLVLVGVAVGFALLRLEASLEEE